LARDLPRPEVVLRWYGALRRWFEPARTLSRLTSTSRPADFEGRRDVPARAPRHGLFVLAQHATLSVRRSDPRCTYRADRGAPLRRVAPSPVQAVDPGASSPFASRHLQVRRPNPVHREYC